MNVETEVHNELTAIGHGGYYVTGSVYAVPYFCEGPLGAKEEIFINFVESQIFLAVGLRMEPLIPSCSQL